LRSQVTEPLLPVPTRGGDANELGAELTEGVGAVGDQVCATAGEVLKVGDVSSLV